MGMLCRNLGKSQAEVSSLLNQAANQKRGLTDNVVRNDEWTIVEEVFRIVGRLTPESYRKHRIPLLKLPKTIQEVLQAGKLHYTKVNEILKVKDPEQQELLLKEVVEKDLSIGEIQECVKDLRSASKQSLEGTKISIDKRLLAVSRQIEKTKVWQDPTKQKKLEKLLAELERLL
jgi:ParB family transcriptional regulator, chromosome partitioning protein